MSHGTIFFVPRFVKKKRGNRVMSKSSSTLIGLALALTTAVSSCGKDNPVSVPKAALTAAKSGNGSADPNAGNALAQRADDARPAANPAGFADALTAKTFVDER